MQPDAPRPPDAPQPAIGVDWTKAGNAAFGPRDDFSYTMHAGKLWLAGGVNNNGDLTDVWSSSDGVTWTAATANAGIGGEWAGCMVSLNGSLWMINNSTIYSSPDGVTWTAQGAAPTGYVPNNGGSPGPGCVVWNNTWWLVAPSGASQPVWSSPDGTTWTKTANGFGATNSSLTLLVFGNELVAASTNGIFASADGATWLPKTLSFRAVGPTLAADGTLWSFDGNNMFALSSSTDGVNWTVVQRSLPWRNTTQPPNTNTALRTAFAFYALGTPAKLFIAGGAEGERSSSGQLGAQYDGDIWTSP